MFHSKTGLAALTVSGLLAYGHSLDIKETSSPSMTIHATVNPSIKAQLESSMNSALAAGFTRTLADARAQLAGFNEQKKLAQGFANANAYSMHSGTLQGYQNYDLFALSGGVMIGLQAPSTDFGYYDKIGDEINEKGDIYAGIGAGLSFLNLGINAGMLVPGLYVNVKYGAMDYDFGDFAFDFSVMGLGANYRMFDSKSLVGLVKWRGLSLGSGFYLQSNKIEYLSKQKAIKNEIAFRDQVVNSAPDAQKAEYENAMNSLGFTESAKVNMALTPTFNMGLDISTSIIPLDATTALSLLWGMVNLSAGVGVDLVFGSSEIILKGAAEAVTESPDSTKVSFTPAGVEIDGSSDDGPSFFRPRVMLGAGLGLGPVKLDIPVIYYPSSGMAFGVTGAIVW